MSESDDWIAVFEERIAKLEAENAVLQDKLSEAAQCLQSGRYGDGQSVLCPRDGRNLTPIEQEESFNALFKMFFGPFDTDTGNQNIRKRKK